MPSSLLLLKKLCPLTLLASAKPVLSSAKVAVYHRTIWTRMSLDNLDTHVIGQWTRMSTASPESPRLFSDLHNLLMELHSVHCTSALLRMLTNTFAKEVQTTLPSHFKAVSRRI